MDVKRSLGRADYAVFSIVLGVSAAIGIFHSYSDFRNWKKNGGDQYFTGGGKLHMIPVGFSLSVSFMSAITVLGTPVEVYRFGVMYSWLIVALLIVTVVVTEVFIPTFYSMGIKSTYEYLEKRFNRATRILGTLCYIAQTALYLGLVVYGPSLALSEVTDLGLWVSVLVTGFVCIFYTTLGGIKAVIWTDVFQALIMLAGFLALVIRGTQELGGYGEVWRICKEGNRTDLFDFNPDPRYRNTVWTLLIGGAFMWMGLYGVNQAQVQRYLGCKSLKQAKGSVVLNWFGLLLILSLNVIIGCIMYAYYVSCDPITAKLVKRRDQLLPYWTLELFGDSPGFTGFIMSAIFAGSLSTVSTGINSMACVTIEDLIKPFTKWEKKTYDYLSYVIVFFYGLVTIFLAYLSSNFGGLITAAYSVLGIISGPVLGLFMLGLFFPFANSAGAILGLFGGMGVGIWIQFGKKFYPKSPVFYDQKPFSIGECSPAANISVPAISDVNVTSSAITIPEVVRPALADWYDISYLYHNVYACIGTIVLGVLISLLTGGWKARKDVESKYLYFCCDHGFCSCVPGKIRKMCRCGAEVDDVDDVSKARYNVQCSAGDGQTKKEEVNGAFEYKESETKM